MICFLFAFGLLGGFVVFRLKHSCVCYWLCWFVILLCLCCLCYILLPLAASLNFVFASALLLDVGFCVSSLESTDRTYWLGTFISFAFVCSFPCESNYEPSLTTSLVPQKALVLEVLTLFPKNSVCTPRLVVPTHLPRLA
jgi:hypothetical protein